jgi:uncharacterized BrkB/YihY/UPF0761 family membrane protein
MNKYEQLEKLQSLKERGVLSDAEFDEVKRGILNSNQNSAINSDENQRNLKSNSVASIGLIFGVIGIFVIPLLFGVLGIIFSGVGISNPKETHKGRKNAIAGLILGVVNVIWGFFWFSLL